MESRWYLLPGQTLENTKISDRAHALHIGNTAWKKMTGHLERRQRTLDAIEEERAHRQKLKEGSDAMTRNWPDSIEHVHMHKENERKKQAEELDRKRMENFYMLTKEQADIKEAFMTRVKRAMFYQKCYPKNLNGALMLSEALYERGKQIEFKKMIAEHFKEEERKYAESVKKGAEDEIREKEEKAKEVGKKKKELQDELIKNIKEKEEAQKKAREARIKQELIDNENAHLEMLLEEEIRREDVINERASRKREVEKYLAETAEYKRLIKKEDDEVEEVIQVFEKAKKEIECLRQAKILEHRKLELARREEASKKAVAGAKAKDEAFERSIRLAKEEADAREAAALLAKEEKRRQLRKDREEDRKNYLIKKAEEDRMLAERKKWDMLNRLKTNDAIEEYNQRKREEKIEKALKLRDEILEQIASDEERSHDEQKKIDEHTLKTMKENDDEFFKYAYHVLEYAKENGRNTYPIEKVIDDYKRENLIDVTKKEKPCRAQDGSILHGNVKMVNTTPGKMAHDPRADPNYRRCRCHKEELLH